MSLKAFHIFFIVLSVLTSAFFGAWLLLTDAIGGAPMRIAFASVSFLAGAGLLVYGRFFLRKYKHLSYM